jgi:hypothetical protein
MVRVMKRSHEVFTSLIITIMTRQKECCPNCAKTRRLTYGQEFVIVSFCSNYFFLSLIIIIYAHEKLHSLPRTKCCSGLPGVDPMSKICVSEQWLMNLLEMYTSSRHLYMLRDWLKNFSLARVALIFPACMCMHDGVPTWSTWCCGYKS